MFSFWKKAEVPKYILFFIDEITKKIKYGFYENLLEDKKIESVINSFITKFFDENYEKTKNVKKIEELVIKEINLGFRKDRFKINKYLTELHEGINELVNKKSGLINRHGKKKLKINRKFEDSFSCQYIIFDCNIKDLERNRTNYIKKLLEKNLLKIHKNKIKQDLNEVTCINTKAMIEQKIDICGYIDSINFDNIDTLSEGTSDSTLELFQGAVVIEEESNSIEMEADSSDCEDTLPGTENTSVKSSSSFDESVKDICKDIDNFTINFQNIRFSSEESENEIEDEKIYVEKENTDPSMTFYLEELKRVEKETEDISTKYCKVKDNYPVEILENGIWTENETTFFISGLMSELNNILTEIKNVVDLKIPISSIF